MNNQTKHMIDEADIGSGEKQPGQEDTEKIIEQIGEIEQDAPQESESQENKPEKNGRK